MTWSEHVDNLCSKFNKRLVLLKKIEHLLPHFGRVHYYTSVIQPLFDYGDIVWGDKNNCTLMNNLQILQSKAAKIILDHPLYSSATEALNSLGWMGLAERRRYHRCLYMFRCINGLTFSNLDITAVKETHSYNTRSKNNLRLPKVKRNWGKQRLAYHAGNDWNSLNENIRYSENILQFKISFGKHV